MLTGQIAVQMACRGARIPGGLIAENLLRPGAVAIA